MTMASAAPRHPDAAVVGRGEGAGDSETVPFACSDTAGRDVSCTGTVVSVGAGEPVVCVGVFVVVVAATQPV